MYGQCSIVEYFPIPLETEFGIRQLIMPNYEKIIYSKMGIKPFSTGNKRSFLSLLQKFGQLLTLSNIGQLWHSRHVAQGDQWAAGLFVLQNQFLRRQEVDLARTFGKKGKWIMGNRKPKTPGTPKFLIVRSIDNKDKVSV